MFFPTSVIALMVPFRTFSFLDVVLTNLTCGDSWHS
jgi:hypothetical protein